MKPRLKAIWESLRTAVRPVRVRTVEIPGGDPGALIAAAHWADHSTALRLMLPAEMLVMESGFAYLPGSHHFLAALESGAKALREFYDSFQPVGIAAMSVLAPLFTGRLAVYRPMPHDLLASALIEASLREGLPMGTSIYQYKAIRALAQGDPLATS